MADIEESHDVKPYSVAVEIVAYRYIDVLAVSVEHAKRKAVNIFTTDSNLRKLSEDDLYDWVASAVVDGTTNDTLWLKRGD
tara:strand:- start:4556 stop:4798 length:243 start_codon:yes stop_codon:yes gene_type:complete